jgi:hypothetical protein
VTLKPRNRSAAYSTALVLAILLGIALRHGIETTGDLEWPGHMDLYRDISQARVFLQGNWLGDPFYRDQRLWYSPLVPTIVAVCSKITGLEVHLLYTRLGAYLNLLGVISFFVMVAVYFGQRAALAATVGFVFINGQNLPFWAAASYAPWLAANHFTQTLSYLWLTLYANARTRSSHSRYAVMGCVMGLAFLGHAVAGLVLACAASVITLKEALKRGATGRVRALKALGIMGSSALVVSWPLLYSIVGFYKMRVVNPDPGSWLYGRSFGTLVEAFLALSTPLALVGAVWAWRRRVADPASEIFFAAGATCLGAVALRYATGLLSIAPTHHFVFYLKALEAMFFGVGFAAAAEFLSTRLTTRFGGPARMGAIAFWSALGLLTLWLYPAYSRHAAYTEQRANALAWQQRTDRLAAIDWIEASTSSTDIFLCDDRTALFAIGPAGRYVLAAPRIYSNPYTDWELRDRRRSRLLTFLQEGQEERFREYALRNRIRYAMFEESREEPDHPLNRKSLSRLSCLRNVYQRGLITIYRVVE